MAHIKLDNNLPGIRGLMAYRPETEAPLNALAEMLLRNDNNTLSRGERELIGSYVSYLNDCFFCQNVHGALAGHYLECNIDKIDAINHNFNMADLTDKMKALLGIAESVQKDGKNVSEGQIKLARIYGATDTEIHDTVLIAASFCMFNRYVDGLGTWAPGPNEAYAEMGERMAHVGYGKY